MVKDVARRFELIVFDFTILLISVDLRIFLDSLSGMTNIR